MKRPFVLIGASMFISLFIYSYLGVYAAAAVFVISAFFAIPVFLLRHKHTFFKSAFLCIIALLISSTVFTNKTVYDFIPAEKLCTNNESTVSGTLTEYNNDYGNHYYTLKNISVNGTETKQKIIITAKHYVAADIDDTLTFSVISVNSVGSLGSAMHYKSNGIYLKAYSHTEAIQTKAENHSVFYYLDSLKNFIAQNLKSNLHNGYAQAVNAMITGDKTDLDEKIQQNFRFSGISHLFAVSGFHLSLWTSLIWCFPVNKSKKYTKSKSLFSIAFVIFFMALTGFSQSVVRAGIMQIILFLGKLLRYSADSLNSLFLALSLILAINPFAVMSISLQMSFLATLGIVTLINPVYSPVNKLKQNFYRKLKQKKHLNRLFSVLSSVYTIIAISVISTVFTVPVSAINFRYYSIVAPVTNLLCMPVAQLIMPLSCFSIAFSRFSLICKPVNILCNSIMKYIFSVTDKLAHFSWSVVDTQAIELQITVFLIAFAMIILFIVFADKNKQLLRSISACALCLLIVSVTAQICMAHSHKITVASVGNGTSIVYQAGNKNIIIGCGGNKNKSYMLSNISKQINAESFDLILIPDNAETESFYATEMLQLHKYDKCVISEEKYPQSVKTLLPESTVSKSECNIKIDENTNIVYINNDRFAGARITAKDFVCTILFRPTSDFSAVDPDWLTGNLLITRQNLPDTELSGFDNIFITTSSTTHYKNGNIYSTAVNGELTYCTVPWGGERIYAAQ